MNDCHPNASCVNSQGSYNCSCDPTYIGNGVICKGKFVMFRLRNLTMNVFNVTRERAELVIQIFDKRKHKSMSPNTQEITVTLDSMRTLIKFNLFGGLEGGGG